MHVPYPHHIVSSFSLSEISGPLRPQSLRDDLTVSLIFLKVLGPRILRSSQMHPPLKERKMRFLHITSSSSLTYTHSMLDMARGLLSV